VKTGNPLDVPVGDALMIVRVPLAGEPPGKLVAPGAGDTPGVTDTPGAAGGTPGVDAPDAAGGDPETDTSGSCGAAGDGCGAPGVGVL